MAATRITPPGGVPLSNWARAGDLIFVSGLVPVDSEGKLVGDDVATQTRRCFERIEESLAEAGATLNDIAKATVYLAHAQRDFAEMNQVYREAFSAPYPARSTVGVELAAPGLLVEIEAYAWVAGGSRSDR